MNQKSHIETPPIYSESDIAYMTEALRTSKKAVRSTRRTQRTTAENLGLTLVRSVRPFHVKPRHAEQPVNSKESPTT